MADTSLPFRRHISPSCGQRQICHVRLRRGHGRHAGLCHLRSKQQVISTSQACGLSVQGPWGVEEPDGSEQCRPHRQSVHNGAVIGRHGQHRQQCTHAPDWVALGNCQPGFLRTLNDYVVDVTAGREVGESANDEQRHKIEGQSERPHPQVWPRAHAAKIWVRRQQDA